MTKPDVVTPEQAMAVNRRMWDESVPIHVASSFYDVEGFHRGRCSLSPIEREELGDVAGLDVLHLQCHFGLDSLSLVRRDARVTGLDYSAPAIAAASRLSAETGLEARFIEANVYDAASVAGSDYDLVFTSWGVLCWLPDLYAWAEVIAACLRPGGAFYIAEDHPARSWFDDQPDSDGPLQLTYDYRGDGHPECYEKVTTYADPSATLKHGVEYIYPHNMADVVSALASAELFINQLREHPASVWQALPVLERGDDGLWRVPDGLPSIPLSFSLSAHRP